MGQKRQIITDPERIRALAHPLRLELLEHLRSVDEATATECAEATGESVASCSFHLRMLAKYGYIEPGERRGREKPWKIIREIQDMRPDRELPASMTAVAELATMALLHESERARRFFGNTDYLKDHGLAEVATLTTSDIWVTDNELRELIEEFQGLVFRFGDRSGDPSLRPDGARKARVFGTIYPQIDKPHD